jgi:hypothetical protein
VRQIQTFSDQRLDNLCSYCGDFPDTRDHVPSKILLDEPFPENLPIVPCCLKCNQDFSLDEEYFACAIECMIYGTTEINKLKRQKIKSILSKKEELRQRIESSFISENGNKYFKIENERFTKIIIKLAKGHAKYENSQLLFENPTSIWMKPLNAMDKDEIEIFFAQTEIGIVSEIGSRSFKNMFIGSNQYVYSQWITVQDNNYEYSVVDSFEVFVVKILIMDLLAIEVSWSR